MIAGGSLFVRVSCNAGCWEKQIRTKKGQRDKGTEGQRDSGAEGLRSREQRCSPRRVGCGAEREGAEGPRRSKPERKAREAVWSDADFVFKVCIGRAGVGMRSAARVGWL
jgi:hypothetical protein